MAALVWQLWDRKVHTQAEEWFQTAINQSHENVDNIAVFLSISFKLAQKLRVSLPS